MADAWKALHAPPTLGDFWVRALSWHPDRVAVADERLTLTYRGLRETAKQLARKLPKFFYEKAARAEEYARGFWTGGTLFEELGFYYVGPIDGHNLDHLLPILIHVITQKGKGYAPAEASADKYHGVVTFDMVTGAQAKPKANAPAYTKVFGESLAKEARRDDKIVAITAAMPSGTGIDLFSKEFPTRTFDVGIAAVTATMRSSRSASLMRLSPNTLV